MITAHLKAFSFRKTTNNGGSYYENKRKLRVFEAFAGIGAQAAALKKLNIDYEIVGISDWFIDAIECYATIHCEGKVVEVLNTKAEVLEYLSKFTFSADSVHSYNISRLSEDRLKKSIGRI